MRGLRAGTRDILKDYVLLYHQVSLCTCTINAGIPCHHMLIQWDNTGVDTREDVVRGKVLVKQLLHLCSLAIILF